jgi:peroxiredoxin
MCPVLPDEGVFLKLIIEVMEMSNFLSFNKRWVSLILFIVIMAGVVWMQTGTAAGNVGPQVNSKAPDFTLAGPASKNIDLYQVVKENKVTLVNFWGIWCPYCVREIPELVDFYRQYHQRGVEILGVDVGDNPKDVAPFAKKNQMSFPILIDRANTVSELYQIAGFPTTMVIDGQGKIRDIIVGATQKSTLAAKVESILREK